MIAVIAIKLDIDSLAASNLFSNYYLTLVLIT